ncbi:hypothetical protein J6590_023278 [Homalodisca vitripennis]|nr:hypothetical protein J6590_023278 [Homalodisca vitripennis]
MATSTLLTSLLVAQVPCSWRGVLYVTHPIIVSSDLVSHCIISHIYSVPSIMYVSSFQGHKSVDLNRFPVHARSSYTSRLLESVTIEAPTAHL